MLKNVMVAVLVLGMNAVAFGSEKLYSCDFEAFDKVSGARSTRFTYLSPTRFSRVDFSTDGYRKTILDLRVEDIENFVGSVNGQPMFILRGPISHGYFESAFATGHTRCGLPAQDYLVAFMFRPWRSIFVPADHPFKTVSDIKNSCFFGDALEATFVLREAYRLPAGQVGVDANGNVFVIMAEKTCLKYQGGRDDSECVKWSQDKVVIHILENCDYDPEQRP